MAEERGGFRGGPGARPAGGRQGQPPKQEPDWIPVTKLGRLVKLGKIGKIEEIFLHSLAIKEYQIVDHFLKEELKDEVMKIKPVQKQTPSGQRTRFKAFIAIGDCNGHVGLGWKTGKEVQTAIKGAMINAKLSIIPVRRGYWGNKIGLPHTLPMKVKGKSGSVRVRLIPAPRGTGIVAAPASKKILQFAGVADCYTSSQGHTKTMGNFIKATFNALTKSYEYLTPDLWAPTHFMKSPFQEFSNDLKILKAQ